MDLGWFWAILFLDLVNGIDLGNFSYFFRNPINTKPINASSAYTNIILQKESLLNNFIVLFE